jgi:Zn-dependent peptidase ImmA (M78 family)
MKRSEIEKRARQVLRDHGLLHIPVDPLTVARALDTRVVNALFSESGKSGAVARRAGRSTIFVNVNDPPARKRFTIAHEIGHLLLHMPQAEDGEYVDTEDSFRSGEVPYDDTWPAERRAEWEANTFAGALLIDEELLRNEWAASRDPDLLAWKFQVSAAAMAVRLAQLGLV